MFIVFDRLFGTYIPERADLPCRYGLVEPITSHNLFEIEFGQWRALLHDLASARSLRAFAGYLVKPPGWRPNGPGETTEELRQRAALQAAPSHAVLTPDFIPAPYDKELS